MHATNSSSHTTCVGFSLPRFTLICLSYPRRWTRSGRRNGFHGSSNQRKARLASVDVAAADVSGHADPSKQLGYHRPIMLSSISGPLLLSSTPDKSSRFGVPISNCKNQPPQRAARVWEIRRVNALTFSFMAGVKMGPGRGLHTACTGPRAASFLPYPESRIRMGHNGRNGWEVGLTT